MEQLMQDLHEAKKKNSGRNKGAGDPSLDRQIEIGQNRRQDAHHRYGEDVMERKDGQKMYNGRKNLKSHPLVLSKEPMADPAQTPVGTNTSVAKPRRDETPVSAHPYLSGMTNIDAQSSRIIRTRKRPEVSGSRQSLCVATG
ncbi:hypothetical protein R6Q59_023333 [Mikania micrantha]